MDNETNREQENEVNASPLRKSPKEGGGAFKGGKEPSEPRLSDREYARFQAVDEKIMRAFHFFANISAIALIAIMLYAVVDVIGAKLHQAGVMWAHGISYSTEKIQYLHIPLVFLAAGFVTLDQGHTRIDLLCGKFPRWLEKAFAFLGHILGCVLSFFIAFRIYNDILPADILKQKTIVDSGTYGWAKAPFTICFIIGFALLGLSFIWSMVRMIRFWKYPGVNAYYVMHPEKALGPGEEPDAPADEPEEGGEPA